MATDVLKSREPQAKPPLDLSIDSLDLSCEGSPLSITRSGAPFSSKAWSLCVYNRSGISWAQELFRKDVGPLPSWKFILKVLEVICQVAV